MNDPKRRFFSGDTLKQALIQAANHYHLAPEEIAYRTIEKRHGFLKARRKVMIEVDPEAPRLDPAAARPAAPPPEAAPAPSTPSEVAPVPQPQLNAEAAAETADQPEPAQAKQPGRAERPEPGNRAPRSS